MGYKLKTVNVGQLFVLLEERKIKIADFEKALNDLHYQVLLPHNRHQQAGFYADLQRSKDSLLLTHLENFSDTEKKRIKKFLNNPIWEN
jgi:hypothetical protein